MGGTCAETTWRQELINLYNKKYDANDKVEWFNPVVDDWTPECVENEYRMKNKSDYELYVITPQISGVFSIAEVVDASNKKPEKTIFCIIDEHMNKSFEESQLKSLKETENLIKANGANVFNDLNSICVFINSKSYTSEYLPN